jgi:hypothetical protein
MHLVTLHKWWIPVVLAVVAADINFWIFAAIGNAGDFVGIAFFIFFGLYALQSAIARRETAMAVWCFGAALALGLMVLRETDVFDRGYILPYLVFIGFVLLGLLLRRPRRAAA